MNSKNSPIEIAETHIKIQSPPLPFPIWAIFIPVPVLLIAGFFNPEMWFAAIWAAVICLLAAAILNFFYRKYEVLVDFEKQEIVWTGARSFTFLFFQPILSAKNIQFHQIAFLKTTEYNDVDGTRNQPSVILQLKNGQPILLSHFESIWQRDKILKVLEPELKKAKPEFALA